MYMVLFYKNKQILGQLVQVGGVEKQYHIFKEKASRYYMKKQRLSGIECYLLLSFSNCFMTEVITDICSVVRFETSTVLFLLIPKRNSIDTLN